MSNRMSMELTPRQKEIFDWIKGFDREHGMPPTVREIGAAFDIKSSSVFDVLKILEKKGALERGDMGARSLKLKQKRRKPCVCKDVPVVGRIAAGQPIEAIEDKTGTMTVEKHLLAGHEGFALQVSGDSMIDAGILDGDHVVIRKQDTAENGDIVVALIEDEATLKTFYREKNGIRLQPANKRMKAIRVKKSNLRIQGKVVAVHRTL